MEQGRKASEEVAKNCSEWACEAKSKKKERKE